MTRRFSPVVDSVFLVTGSDTIEIMHLTPELEASTVTAATGHAADVSWHAHLPVCAVAAGASILALSSTQ